MTAKNHIVLFEPQIPQNTGNIARTCAATNAPLHIIKPMGFPIDDRKMKRAGLDYWDKLDITYYENLEEFMEQMDGLLYLVSKFAEKVYSEADFSKHENHYFIILIPRDFIEPRFYIRVVHLSELHALKIEQRVRIREFIEYFNVFKETKDPHADLLNMYFMDMHRKLNDYGKGIHLPKLER